MSNALTFQHPALKLPRAMARKKFLKLLRLMKYAKESHLTAVFVCPTCRKPAVLKHGAGLIEGVGLQGGINEKADRFSITCDCTTWTVGA